MFSKIFSMILGGNAAKTTAGSPQPASAAEPASPFQTEKFQSRFETEKHELEAQLGLLKGEIARLEGEKDALPQATSAEAELQRRRLKRRLDASTEERFWAQLQLNDLGRNLVAEEKQYLLDQHLTLPTVLVGEWKEEGECDYYSPKRTACWLAQRQIVRNKEGRYLLVKVTRDSAQSYEWAEPFGPAHVVWVTDSVAQMTEEELGAIVRDQQEKTA